MIYIFLGKEINILNDKLNNIKSKNNINNIIKYDFNNSDLMDILNEACYESIFNEKKLIVASNFSFKKLNLDEEEKFKRFISSSNDNIIIFNCIDEKLDERKSLIKLIKERCNIEDCGKLDYKDLSKYVFDMFKKENIEISFNQVKRILDMCEYATDKTINEVNKLLLYLIGKNKVEDVDIENVISRGCEKEMFSLFESMLKKEKSNCLESYKILVSFNIDTTVIIDSLAKQYRLLFQVKNLYGKINPKEMAYTLDANTYTISKIMPYINSYKNEEIIDKLYKLSDMDYNIKVLGYEPKKVLEMFFLSL